MTFYSHFFPAIMMTLLMLSSNTQGTQGAQQQLRNEHQPRRDQSIPNLYPPDWPFLSNCLNPTSPGGLLDTVLPVCTTFQESDISKSDRIGIVGAGPAGLSMAYLLKKRGFEDIMIFEKEDRVGGKSKNFAFNGDKFDLGTIYTANKYECVELLFDEFGITEVAIDTRNKPRFVTDPVINPTLPVSAVWYKEYTTATYGIEFDNPDAYIARLTTDAQNYVGLWTQSMGSFDYLFPDESTVNFDLLNVSYLEWLEQRQLFALIPRLHISMSAQGYGSLGEIPAFYGLMWIHPNFFGNSGTFSVVQQDWQTLWEQLVDDLNLNVVLEASIFKIERNDNLAHILYRNSGEENVIHKTFDHLIMAMPMPDGLALLDATDDELELFSHYNYKSARIDLGKVNDAGLLAAGGGLGAPFDVELFSWIGRVDQQTDYHVKSFDATSGETSRFQWKTDGVDGILTIIRQALLKQRVSNKEVSVLWSIVPLDELGTDDVTSSAGADLNSIGVEFEHIFTNSVPDYMPWKNLTDVIEERVPWKIWDNQGTLNTWFIGSYTSFESIADVLDYNLKLVNERLCEN